MNKLDDILGTTIKELESTKAVTIPKKKTGKSPCDNCTLLGKTPVPYEGNLGTARVLFIGEAPGELEDEQGRPFVGRSGEYLRTAIEGVGIKPEDVVYTNVCKCRPPNNRNPAKSEITACKKYLKQEIADFQGDLIVLLGAVPLETVLKKRGLLNLAGYGFFENGKHIFVTYHPAFILRNQNTAREDAFLEDLGKVKAYLDNRSPIVKVYVDTMEDLELMLSELLSWEGQCNIAFDVETSGFDWQKDNLYSLALSTKDRNWFIPLEFEGSPFKDKADWVLKQIEVLFTNDKFRLIAQNAKFDIKFLRQHGIIVTNLWFDTMVAHYLLVGKFIPHKLKAMAWKYTTEGGYDVDRGSLEELTMEELATYNTMDTYMTQKLCRIFIEKMDQQQLALMANTIAPGITAVAEMEFEGVLLDQELLVTTTDKYIEEVTALEVKMHSYPKIKQIEEASKRIINFSSPKQLGRVFELLGISTGKFTKKTSQMSTDQEALEGVKHKHGLIKDLIDFRKKDKILGTYLKPYVEKQKEGRIHADYSFITTATGRLSSFNPNFQNIPYDTRPVFVSKYGYFLEFDYSQLELRVLAMLANDKALLETFRSGDDVHEATRFIMYGDNSDKSPSVQKEQRVHAKSVNFGIIYGIGPHSLAKELKKPKKVAEKWIGGFYDAHPEVREYQKLVWEHVKTYGYIDTPFSRTRYFNIKQPSLTQNQLNAMYREAINMPIQGTASDIVVTGLGRFWKEFRKQGFKSKFVWEVHDSIGLDCYEDELPDLMQMGQEILEGVSYGWMRNVPLVVDVEVGTHWGKLEKI